MLIDLLMVSRWRTIPKVLEDWFDKVKVRKVSLIFLSNIKIILRN
jgi:hypothetical protein